MKILEKLLKELLDLKEKTADNKALLKNYKIKSDKLTQLLSAKKDLMTQINDEKDRIEDEMLEDTDYAEAKKTQKELKIQTSEKNSEIREEVWTIPMDELAKSIDFIVDGEPLKLQVEKFRKVYINGSEQK